MQSGANFRLSIPHLFEKKKYVTPVSCSSCKSKIWGKGYYCAVCKCSTHSKCVSTYIENTSCVSNDPPPPPPTAEVPSLAIPTTSNANSSSSSTPTQLSPRKPETPEQSLPAVALGSARHASMAFERSNSISKFGVKLPSGNSNPQLIENLADLTTSGRGGSSPDVTKRSMARTDSLRVLPSSDSNSSLDIELPEEALRLDNLTMQVNRAKLRIKWAKAKKPPTEKIETLIEAAKKRRAVIESLLAVEDRKLELMQKLVAKRKEQRDLSDNILKELGKSIESIKLTELRKTVEESPNDPELNQNLMQAQQSCTALESTMLLVELDKLQHHLLTQFQTSFSTNLEAFETVAEKLASEEKNLQSHIEEFDSLNGKLSSVTKTLTTFQTPDPDIPALFTSTEETKKLFSKHGTESEEQKIIDFCYVTSNKEDHDGDGKDGKDILFMKSGKSDHVLIRAATRDKLVERLTWAAYPDPLFQKAFLLTYKSFMTPQELLQKLILRYCITPPPSESQLNVVKRKHQTPIQLRVLKVLRQWIDYFPSHFDDGDIKPQLQNFVEHIVSVSNPNIAPTILSAFQRKNSHTTTQTKMFSKPAPEPILPPNMNNIALEDIDPTEIARQLTLLEHEVFQKIQPNEFLNQGWNKSNKEKSSPNILQMIRMFNKCSRWVTAEIVFTDDLIKRGNKIKKFIRIAQECFKISNLNAVMQITAGLTSASVARLKRTWETLEKEYIDLYNNYKSLMDSNYSKFRTHLATCTPPCLPYVGVFLTDLTFAEEGNSNHVEHMVNFFKYRQVADIIRYVEELQQENYNFTAVKPIQDWLLNIPEHDETEVYNQSLRAESKKLDKMLGKANNIL